MTKRYEVRATQGSSNTTSVRVETSVEANDLLAEWLASGVYGTEIEVIDHGVGNLEVLFDDGGGILVQCDEFVHSYDDPAHAAEDVAQLLDGTADPENWENNQPECRVADDQARRDAIRNGGYEVMDEADLREAMADINGRAKCEFLAALTGRAVAA